MHYRCPVCEPGGPGLAAGGPIVGGGGTRPTGVPNPEGRKDDNGKDRWDLLPLGPVREVVKVLGFGARKYAPNNWQKVENGTERYYASLMRHLYAWRSGEEIDGESGLKHLAHAACCIMFLLWLDLQPKEKKS